MAEKILKTRIALKIDSLENWESSTLPLKLGEVAFATIAATIGEGLVEPVIMIKVCSEEGKTFNELPWSFYANAADVLSACKDEAALTTFVNNVITEAELATNEAMTTLAERVTTIEGLVGEKSVTAQITEAIEALDLINTYDEKGAAAQALVDAKTYADGKDSAIATAKKAGDDAQAAVDVLAGKVGVVPADTTVVEMTATAVATEKERAEGVESGLRADVDAIKADYLTSTDKEALQTQINTIMNNPDTEGVINSIEEFTEYIEVHGEIAEGFRSDIDANAKAITELATASDDKYETKTDATTKNSAMDARVRVLEAIEHDAYVAADETVLANAKSYTDEKVSTKLDEITTTIDGGLKVTNKNQIDIDDEIVFVFNCGNASDL